MDLDPRFEVYEAAERIRNALTRLGYCYRTKNDDLIEISFRQLGVVSDQYGVLEVDVQRLPPRVSIAKLTHPDTIHHLKAVVGKPVHKLNTTGLTYCIELQPQHKQRLPTRVKLDLSTRPSGTFMIPIGQTKDGAEWRSLLEMSHILVGGESRSGKSTWLNAMLVALLATYTPQELQLALIDPKGVEFTPFDGIPHLVKPVAIEPRKATEVTGWLVAEMDRRRELFAGVFARNLTTYNQRMARVDEPALPLILVVIDEVSDIALQAGLKSTFYKNLIRLSSKGAAFGLIMVLSTQNPKAEVLNTLIRGNMSTRIAFRVTTSEHSRTILGCAGAQNLPRTIRGRMVARMEGALVELQGFHVSDDAVLALTRRWAAANGATLLPIERELVLYAHEELDGAFPIKRLYEQFKGQISHRQLVKLGQRWEHNGWLSPPESVVDARRVTEELLRIVFRTMAGQDKLPETASTDETRAGGIVASQPPHSTQER
ncbi:MAG: DNA translocase FtsK [Anaerolineae bacterium]|nr:DNA translocase FtsK [Anaerolineae bacterium]